MPASSLLALIDDIASVLDDISLMTKAATKKTAGVLGDDLALNAQQVSGIHADRELPVVWAVAKGSLVNKAILVPAALAISAFAPWAVIPLLMVGGLYLCYEGFEKIAHRFMPGGDEEAAHKAALKAAIANPATDMVALERQRIKGAVRTDFILSAEIIVIALGTVAEQAFSLRVGVLVAIALVMTVGVYGLVAGIVKLDDFGLYLSSRGGAGVIGRLARATGRVLVSGSPYLMKALSIAGTAAMFLVGGGILVHGLPWIERAMEPFVSQAGELPGVGGAAKLLATPILNAVAGVIAGALALVVVAGVRRMLPKRATSASQ